ncbi:MAG: type restriction enzyme EcoKI specificity protein [Nitrospirota bacterium]|jgi:type I restriction enzyme S subunit
MKLETFFNKFDQFAGAPDAVAKMRELVLLLAVQGKLVEQRTKELSARECIRKANKPLVDLAPDELVETPAGWVALPLGCLIASNTGGGTPSKQNPSYWSGPIPWASVKDVQSEKYLVSTIDSISEEGLKDSSSNLIPPNRLIVVTRMGLGKLAINTIPVAINQDLRAIEPTTALDLDFAYLLFKSLKMVGSGVTVKGITVDKLHAMPVLLPPLAEQKRIVAKVDELMALCDRLEAQQQERETRHAALARASLARFADAPTPANLNFLFHPSYTISPSDLRKSILTLAVQGKLVPQDPNDEPAEVDFNSLVRTRETSPLKRTKIDGEATAEDPSIPDSWLGVSLGELVSIRTGFAFKSGDYAEQGTFILRVTNINPDGSFDTSNAVFLPEAKLDEKMQGFLLEERELLVVMVGGSLGKIGQVTAEILPALLNQNMWRLKPYSDRLDYRFLRLVLHDLNENRLQITPSTHGHLAMGTYAAAKVPFPPLAEQRRIVAKVDQLMALVDQLETQLVASRATAEKLMEAVVAELTT